MDGPIEAFKLEQCPLCSETQESLGRPASIEGSLMEMWETTRWKQAEVQSASHNLSALPLSCAYTELRRFDESPRNLSG